MAEENDPQDVDQELPPPTDESDAPRREKKKGLNITQGKLFIGVIGVMFAISAYTLLGTDDELQIPGGDQGVEAGGAEVETELGEFERDRGATGGVGQERAEVLSEIDEREALQRRIESGQSAVSFGEVTDEDETVKPKPKPKPSSAVFGDVTPREPAEEPQQPQRRTPRVAPISGTPAPQVQGQSGGGPGVAYERIQYELDLAAQNPGPANTSINYSQSSSSAGAGRGGMRDQPHPITPELSKTGASSGAGGKGQSGEKLALPGDVTIAYLSNRISSDQPSARVRADILEGKLRGGRMLGEAGFEGERLILNFDQLVYEGEVYDSVHAVAVDPSTMDASMQDGIRRKLFTRYGVPVLAGIAAIGIDYQADRRNPSVTEKNLTTGDVVSRRSNEAGNFGEYAASSAADGLKIPLEAIAERAANTQPEVWAEPGAIGLMFTTSVER